MKLVTYVHDGAEKAGALIGKAEDRVLDLRAAGSGEPAFARVLAPVAGGDRIWDKAKTLAAKAGGDHVAGIKDVKLQMHGPMMLPVSKSLPLPGPKPAGIS